jgi:hypothetical protein
MLIVLWVAHYGLPAAGVISLALLTRPDGGNKYDMAVPRSRMLQYLCVFVAEIRMGAIIQSEDPNFALFMQATETIQCLLDSAIVWNPPTDISSINLQRNPAFSENWDPYFHLDPWDFEQDFWANLAEHPNIANQGVSNTFSCL